MGRPGAYKSVSRCLFGRKSSLGRHLPSFRSQPSPFLWLYFTEILFSGVLLSCGCTIVFVRDPATLSCWGPSLEFGVHPFPGARTQGWQQRYLWLWSLHSVPGEGSPTHLAHFHPRTLGWASGTQSLDFCQRCLKIDT